VIFSDRVEDVRVDQPAAAEPSKKRRNRKVLIITVLLLLVPILAVGGYAAWLSHIVSSNVNHEKLLPGLGPVDGDGNAVSQPPGNGTNYLIIGNDAGPDREGARSDVMVIAHVAHDDRHITLVHFPRDLWVPIPGRGEAKLNAAYSYDGAPLLVRTMQNMLGIRIDHVAELGFEQFKRMTDAVGGVDVFVEEPSSRDGFTFERGMTHMSGARALSFVRERKQLSEGDISRGQRQLAFLKALMVKGLSKQTLANPFRLATFLNAATKNLTVDDGLDTGKMRSQAFALRHVRGSDIRLITAPFTGFGRSADGQSIDIVDQPGMRRLGSAIREDKLDTFE
jgi:polyisoprenyl-teichoic acid--peptidoglycan teichoic acid transferase